MTNLTVEETAEELIYTSTNGAVITVRKDDANLDVRQITPVSVSGLTWQQLRDNLEDRL